ncbi:GDSL-type esterase/lipase family protein [Fictibacillus iocasae]|uniref:GDSL-type esterase/lipase family protein n=1 Tax=Fictibacillus iocasae TaxID=2715437 RepID=A0ABW2NTS4_9BACL
MTKLQRWMLAGGILAALFFGSLYFSQYKEKKDEPIRVTALGDSLTYGVGDPSRKGYIGFVTDAMERRTGRPVSLNNFGISGQRSDQLLHQLGSGAVLRSIQRADTVFVFIGTNDYRQTAKWNFKKLPLNKMGEGEKKLEENLTDITAIIRKQNPSAKLYILGLYNPYFGDGYDTKNGPIIQSWNETIKKVADKTALSLYIPTEKLFVNISKPLYFSDSIHPNTRGYEKMGTWVAKHWSP